MIGKRLQSRFIVAGLLLVAATVGSSLWSGFTFSKLNTSIEDALKNSQQIIDLISELHSCLEREDDALLLFLSGQMEEAQQELVSERQKGDEAFQKLGQRLQNNDDYDEKFVAELRQHMARYRAAGDELVKNRDPVSGLRAYHLAVNPLLRSAVEACDTLREANFRTIRDASLRTKEETAKGTRLLWFISLATIVLGVAVAVWLARSILVPVKELIDSMEEVRRGNFERQVKPSADELGQLGIGFNRMAESLEEYRRSSLGELLAAKTTLEATLDALPDAVLVFSADGTLSMLNPPAKKILAAKGNPAASSLGQLAFSDHFETSVRAALHGQPPAPRPTDFRHLLTLKVDGELRRFISTAVPVAEAAPKSFGAVVVLDDVTEFVRLDELRTELIGVASHELKSPLTSLQMNLMMLGERSIVFPDREQELISAAVAGCEELAQTIDELLDVTRIEAGQLRLNAVPVELVTLLEAIQKSLLPRFQDAGVALLIDTPGIPTFVHGDSSRLKSVFINLLTNALKYSSSGAIVTAAVSLQNTQLPNMEAVQIAITDQGPGIPAEFRERIFEKFFRVEHHLGTRGKEVRGTGIGLYLCREIIKSHGGSIACEPGNDSIGTRFVITLPATSR